MKISRISPPFWGFGTQFFEEFNDRTKESGNYFFVALVSNKSGWVLSKKEILNKISEGSLSQSKDGREFKIARYNMSDRNSFASVENFLDKIRV